MTITGSFFSVACCFWQPATERVAAQASSKKTFERDRRLGGEDGKADDVAFLLIIPLSPREAAPDGGTSRIKEDNRSAGKGNHFRTFIAGLVEIDFGPKRFTVSWKRRAARCFCWTQFRTENRFTLFLELLLGQAQSTGPMCRLEENLK
ncbi:hypothetical protein RFN29_18030 [Mesorhizobium sp. VK22B]|uniref:Secreted protein n=1 Tax=Mesorhizobium captivum TaxID=3072319 RepID=A0ABU4Z2N1_9HYPH|nr:MULTISPECIES: hypothetical protein [unclassified Mesorhizobium]MDX8493470.1 hypothetical protein [Mesorhizobium sp. VK22B]MDX8506659.1 hypothetical protein [Mesorhizobium sp. VK22E]